MQLSDAVMVLNRMGNTPDIKHDAQVIVRVVLHDGEVLHLPLHNIELRGTGIIFDTEQPK